MAWIRRKKRNENSEEVVPVEMAEAPRVKKEKEREMKIQGVLFEIEGRESNLEQAKNEKEGRREYYDGKAVAMKLEEKNNSKVYAFPSLNGGPGEWYKIGGKSALFYKYLLGPRMGRKNIKIRKDNDLRLRFKHGLASVHFGEQFIKAAEKVGYKTEQIEYGIIVVDLGQKFTVKEIKDMSEKEKNDREKLQTMIMPKENMPDLYVRIREFARLLVPKVKQMHPAYRETFGMDLLDTTADLFKIYFRVANGEDEKEVGERELLARVDDMTGMIALADEIELFDLVTRTRLGEYLVDIRAAIERNFRKK